MLHPPTLVTHRALGRFPTDSSTTAQRSKMLLGLTTLRQLTTSPTTPPEALQRAPPELQLERSSGRPTRSAASREAAIGASMRRNWLRSGDGSVHGNHDYPIDAPGDAVHSGFWCAAHLQESKLSSDPSAFARPGRGAPEGRLGFKHDGRARILASSL